MPLAAETASDRATRAWLRVLAEGTGGGRLALESEAERGNMGNDAEAALIGQEIRAEIGSVAGSCIGCGFLAMRASRIGGTNRTHTGYFEFEAENRSKLSYPFDFVPGESNAFHAGELACFRGAANLPAEIAEAAKAKGTGESAVAEEVLRRSRGCRSWTTYETGLDPRRHFEELKARALEDDRRKFALDLAKWEQQQNERETRQDRRLTHAAIWIGGIIGVAQIIAAALAMTEDSLGLAWLRRLWVAVVAWFQQAT